MKSGPIIIVEDDADDQLLICEICEKLNPGKVVVCDNGQTALDYLVNTSDQPFLILCDVNMPVMNGLELRTEIIKNEYLKRKSIPFVFFSTVAMEREVSAAYDLVVQGYFEKGSNYEELFRKLSLLIEYWRECKHPNSFW